MSRQVDASSQLLGSLASRLPAWVLPSSAALFTLLSSGLAYATGGAGQWIDIQVIYIFVAVFSAYFFGGRLLAFQLALIAVADGLVLALTEPTVSSIPRWVATVVASMAAAMIVRGLRRRVLEIVDGLSDAARTDPLTGLQNRRGFEESFSAEVERARREGRSLTVLLADLDNFKSLNDLNGHPAGDAALVRVGRLLLGGLRRPDPVARTGGEEFALILPGAAGELAWGIAERIRTDVEEAFRNDSVPLTISLGLAQFPQDGSTADSLLDAADQALYAAKRLGRNRSVIFSEEIAPLVRERNASADTQLATLLGLAEALDLRDAGTADHCRTVGRLCAMTAEQLGMPAEKIARLETAGILHDVGKIGLPDEILRKPGKLSAEEWRPLRRHPEIGARILGRRRVRRHPLVDRGPPRAHRRQGLPERPVRRRYPARGADHRRRGCLRGDDEPPRLPRGTAARPGPRRAAALRRHPVRPDGRGRLHGRPARGPRGRGLLPAEEPHRAEQPAGRPDGHHGGGGCHVDLSADDRGREAVDHVLERQRLGDRLQRPRQVVGRVEDARDEDQRQEDRVLVGGRGVRRWGSACEKAIPSEAKQTTPSTVKPASSSGSCGQSTP